MRLPLAMLSLVSLMAGPPPAGAAEIVAKQCGGPEIRIPFKRSPRHVPEPCHEKACHAGNCRKTIDLRQGKAPRPRP